ncbi:MAG: superoxide dismutase [Deltaproteobacteria bacterium]|nr:superoxide dismutase [Deltaproteobacteria bacterium]
MKSSILTLISIFLFTGNLYAEFKLDPLDYAYNALEPYIDAQTMEIHHSKHHAAYVNNLNKAIKGTAFENKSLEEIMKNISTLGDVVRNNGGGHYNHRLFWALLSAKKSEPSEALKKDIEKTFGDMDQFKKKMNSEAMARFGSGWVWLVVTPEKKLTICSTPNQDNPLMDIAQVKGAPILGIDVWEHAYYLKYQNKRGDYLESIWNVINWETVNGLYNEALK